MGMEGEQCGIDADDFCIGWLPVQEPTFGMIPSLNGINY
jgi:hypothetical protein